MELILAYFIWGLLALWWAAFGFPECPRPKVSNKNPIYLACRSNFDPARWLKRHED